MTSRLPLPAIALLLSCFAIPSYASKAAAELEIVRLNYVEGDVRFNQAGATGETGFRRMPRICAWSISLMHR